MALPFRRRMFVILVVMTVVPTVLAVAGWVLSVRRLLPAAGARASTERVAATARSLLEGVDTLHLTVRERALLRDHLNEVSASVDRKSTRLNSSHGYISYAVFCLKKKNTSFESGRPTRVRRGCVAQHLGPTP